MKKIIGHFSPSIIGATQKCNGALPIFNSIDKEIIIKKKLWNNSFELIKK